MTHKAYKLLSSTKMMVTWPDGVNVPFGTVRAAMERCLGSADEHLAKTIKLDQNRVAACETLSEELDLLGLIKDTPPFQGHSSIEIDQYTHALNAYHATVDAYHKLVKATVEMSYANLLMVFTQTASGHIRGYIEGKGLGAHTEDILTGRVSGSRLSTVDPDPAFTFDRYPALIAARIESATAYVDRWAAYKTMFEELDAGTAKVHRRDELR